MTHKPGHPGSRNVAVTLTEAESLFQQGKYDEAALALTDLVEKDPFTAMPRLRIGQLHFRFRRFSAAVTAWDQLYDVLLEKPMQLNDEVGRLGPEVLTLEDLLPFANQYPPAAQVRCLIGDAYLGLEDWNRSLTSYGQALKITPRCLPALKGQAQCHIKLREFDKARRELLDYLEENPRDAKAYRLLAMVARANGWHDQQMNLLHCAILIVPGHLKSLDSVSRFLEQQNRHGDALRLYREAIAVKGESPELLNNRARLELEISKQNPVSLSPIKRAIRDLERSLNLEPNQSQMQLMLANLRDVEQQSAPLGQTPTPEAVAGNSLAGTPPATAPQTADSQALTNTSSAILTGQFVVEAGRPPGSPGPVPGGRSPGPGPHGAGSPITSPVSKAALSVGLAESISMLPPWDREPHPQPHHMVEEENVEPVSLGLEVILTPEKIADLIEKAKHQEQGELQPSPARPRAKLFTPPPEAMHAVQPQLNPMDIAQLVHEAEVEDETKPLVPGAAIFRPAPPSAVPVPPVPSPVGKILGALKPLPAVAPPATLKSSNELHTRVDRKQLRTPVKRAAPGRKGAKKEMLSAWELKQKKRAANS